MYFYKHTITSGVAAAALAFMRVKAETHTISFTNNCGFGTPTLKDANANTLSTGGNVTFYGAFYGGIAFLQTGDCGDNGESCTLIETSLVNGDSSSDISLIPPHTFSVTSGFGYYNGCDGAGADCKNPNCGHAFHTSDETTVQVGCPADDVDLAITFCH